MANASAVGSTGRSTEAGRAHVSVMNLTGRYLLIGTDDQQVEYPRRNDITIRVQRRQEEMSVLSKAMGVQVVTHVFEGDINDLPIPQEGVYLIVEREVVESVVIQGDRTADDLLFPEEPRIGLATAPGYWYERLASLAKHDDWYPSPR